MSIVTKDIMSITDLSTYTGLSKSSCYKLTMNKTIPYYKVGKFLYFRLEEVKAWLLRNQVVSLEDLNIEPLKSSNV